MKLICRQKYLLLPINSDTPCQVLRFYENETLVLDLKLALDPEHPQYYASYTIERFTGKTLRLETESGTTFELRQTDAPKCADEADEACRPVVHFSAPQGWLNDPNGLVYYKGIWHLFYQHNPVGRIWNNMHWGHAESRDLIHWEDKGDVLFPDDTGTMYSGSAIVDTNDLLHVKNGENDAIVLFYTAAGDSSEMTVGKPYVQCLAYSTDGGNTFKKYGKPIVPQLVPYNRDPKVVFCEETGTYIMSLYLTDDRYALLSSENLTDWTKIDEITLEHDAECPDFYPLAASDGTKKWVLSGASDRYKLGRFDGKHFVPETESLTLSQGYGYASQTWSGVSDGRTVRISWNRAPLRAKCFDKSMTIPVELTLRNGKVCAYPVREIEACRTELFAADALTVLPDADFRTTINAKAVDILFELSSEENAVLSANCFGVRCVFDRKNGKLICNDKEAVLPLHAEALSVRILIDAASAEIFIGDGETYLIAAGVADHTQNTLTVKATDGAAELEKLCVYALK